MKPIDMTQVNNLIEGKSIRYLLEKAKVVGLFDENQILSDWTIEDEL